MEKIKLFTIGFAGKSARVFFGKLKEAGVAKVIDVRLYNSSQLAGYTKKSDLEYFLKEIVPADYIHMPAMSPTKEMLQSYKNGTIDWEQYEKEFDELISKRLIENSLVPSQTDKSCFLCSESQPDFCHRRLVVEYLAKQWGNVEIYHL